MNGVELMATLIGFSIDEAVLPTFIWTTRRLIGCTLRFYLTRAPLGSGESHILLGGGGGGGVSASRVVSQTIGPISKMQTIPFDSPARELSKHYLKFDLEVTDDVTGQVKIRMLDFSGLVTSASTISMLSANEANESAWIVSLTFLSIILCAF